MQKLGFPTIPPHYMQAATDLLKEKIRAKTSLILSRDDLSPEEKGQQIDEVFVWDDMGNDLSIFLHSVEYAAIVFDKDRTDEPNFTN